MHKEDLALNNLQWLICHKTKPNQTGIGRNHLIGGAQNTLTASPQEGYPT